MLDFSFCSPTKFIFGKEAENKCGAVVKECGGTNALIHYGGGSVVKSGLLERVKASLSAQNIAFTELGGAQPNPRDTLVYEGINLVKEKGIDFILAVGGGSAIDSAKAIALGVPYEGDFWDFYSGKKSPEKAMPVGTVLTIPAAGSEGSPSSVITKEDGMIKRGLTDELIRPVCSFLNPELTYTLPAYQTACGATDIMAHVFERYFTNTKDVELTDRMCESVLLCMINETPKAIENPEDYGARANMMWASTVAHTNLLGVGRQQDWSSHDIEHELSGLYDCAHGAGLAVIMPAWMTYVVDHDVMRFAQAAVRLWGCEMDFRNPKRTALAGIDAFKCFLSSIGMPISFKELGAKEEDIPVLVKNFGLGDGKRNGFMELTSEDIANIYQIAAK